MKYILAIIFCLGALPPLSAQKDSSRYRNVSFGIKAGVSGGSLYGKDLSRFSANGYVKPLPGIMFGIEVQTRFSKFFGLQSEIAMEQNRVTIRMPNSANGMADPSAFNSTYLIIAPLTPTFYLQRFRLAAGPYVAGLVNSNLQNGTNIYGSPGASGGFRYKMDAGILMQLRYEIKCGLSIGAAYQRGFIPVLEDPRTQNQWKIYNQQYNFFIGYRWQGRK
jgi:hypothetical protein